MFRGVFWALFAVLVFSSSSLAASRPNLLFLFADDQCYETIGALGHTDIETPNLDRLVKRGTCFTHAYNMGSWSGAVCIASRAMLITGRGLWDAHAVSPTMDAERAAGRLWPQRMRAAGYQTYFTGKWHIGADVAASFDMARNVRGSMPADTVEAYNRPRPGAPDPWDPSDPRFGGFWEGGRHWSDVVRDDAIDFLRRARRSDKPFFMYIAFNAPHDPRQSPKEYVDKYPLERIALPKNFAPLYPFHEAMGCGPEMRDEALAPFPRTEHAVKVHRREYYAAITYLDAQIGRILDALEESGTADNTWIFYTADHGLAVGHHGLFGKQNMYDHSLRVPLIVAGPGVARDRRLDMSVYLQDVMPTALELAGAPRPDYVYFHSLLPQLNGATTQSPYDAVYGAFLDLQRAVIEDGYKLILYPEARAARLYHLEEDPDEMHDLAAAPDYRETKRKLFRRLLVLQQGLGDRLDLRRLFPELAAD